MRGRCGTGEPRAWESRGEKNPRIRREERRQKARVE